MNILVVTSESNPQIRDMARLLTPKGRREADTFLAEGRRVIREAALAGLKIRRLAVQNELIESDLVREMLRMEHLKNIPVLKVPRGLIKKLSSVETPQGIIAEIKRPAEAKADPPEGGLSVACEQIQDPRNLGMLVRSAHAAGVKRIYLGPGSVDCLHPTAVNSSAGSIFHVELVPGCDLPVLIKGTKKNGVSVWATAAAGGMSLPAAAAGKHKGVLLLFGNEGAGLSPKLKSAADSAVSIPMPGGAESLNIAAAAAVILFYLNMKDA